MARLRQNFQSGELSAGLTIGGLTLTSAELASFQAVTGADYAVIVLDPQGVDGGPEIVHVTAHTAAAQTATITRAQEGTVARAHNAGTDWEHNITEDDFTYSNLDGLPVITAGVAIEDEGSAEGQATTINFTGAGVDVTFAAGEATVDIGGGGSGLVIARSDLTSGNLTINSTTWTNAATATDITIPAVVGDWVQVSASGLWSNNAIYGYLDAVSLVGGSPVNSWGSNGAPDNTHTGIQAWYGPTGAFASIAGGVARQVVSGDLSGGNLTLRLRARTETAGNKNLFAVAATRLTFQAQNLGQ